MNGFLQLSNESISKWLSLILGLGYSRDFGAYIRIGLIGAAEHES